MLGVFMQALSVAVRTITIVLGIAALASLLNKMVADSGLKVWMLMQQQTLPGALWGVSAIDNLTYGFCVILISYGVARGYWHELFPDRISLKWLAFSFALGIAFAMFLNQPLQAFLFDGYFGKSTLTGGAVAESVAANILAGFSNYQRFFTFAAFATIVVTPFVEELTHRGILFRQADALPIWQVALLSLVVFCFSNYTNGGMIKVLAVVPSALFFVAMRLKSGSFVYAAAAHIAMNFAAVMRLQVF